jgi:hypothetical protein
VKGEGDRLNIRKSKESIDSDKELRATLKSLKRV